jgi:hypothetical protein
MERMGKEEDAVCFRYEPVVDQKEAEEVQL